jgi:hypothetical protein
VKKYHSNKSAKELNNGVDYHHMHCFVSAPFVVRKLARRILPGFEKDGQ